MDPACFHPARRLSPALLLALLVAGVGGWRLTTGRMVAQTILPPAGEAGGDSHAALLALRDRASAIRSRLEATPPPGSGEAAGLRVAVLATLPDAGRGNEAERKIREKVILDSFHISVAVEWPTFDQAEAGWRDWCGKLAAVTAALPADSPELPDWEDLPWQLSVEIPRRWLEREPAACAAWIDRCTAKGAQPPLPPAKADWHWWRRAWEIGLWWNARLVRDPVVAERLRARGDAWLNAYAANPSESFVWRLSSIVTRATYLYTWGQADQAAALLDEFARQHGPTVRDDADWLSERFLIAALGQGDAALAKRLFREAERLVAEGRMDAGDLPFQLMAQHYYELLPQPAVVWRVQAGHGMAAARQRWKARLNP